jgi:hypothetical protein
MTTVADSWVAFRNMAVPKAAGPVQVAALQRAFYAGAYFLLVSLHEASDDTVSDQQGVAHLEALKREIEEFAILNRPAVDVAPPPEPVAPSRILVPDTNYTTSDPANIRPVLQELGARISSVLPDAWGFTLLLFPFGEPAKEGGTFYIANAERADVLNIMRQFIRSQIQ